MTDTSPIFNASLNDGKTVVALRVDDPPTALDLDAEGVDGIVRTLGELRQLMTPEIPRVQAPWNQVLVIPDPMWATQHDVLHDNPVLSLRDPRFGWLHYLLPPNEAKALADSLHSLAAQLEEGESGKPN